LLVLLGVEEIDDASDVDWLAGKIARMRIFGDAEGKMNLPVVETGGGVLVVSQFTLHVQRIDGTAQSRALGEALGKACTKAEVRGFDGFGLKGRAEINRRLGDPAYPATPVVDEWLRQALLK
jgi:hypothetical protein